MQWPGYDPQLFPTFGGIAGMEMVFSGSFVCKNLNYLATWGVAATFLGVEDRCPLDRGWRLP